MITRRSFLLMTGAAAVTGAPRVAMAQPPGKPWRIGLVVTTAGLYEAYSEAFRLGLREHGFTVGEDVSIEYRQLDPLRPTSEVAELVRANVNVIVAYGAPAVLAE